MKNTALKKHKIFLKIALIIIAVCLMLSLPQTALASGTFRVTGGVHVRESASTSSKSLTTVIVGSSVDVIEHNPAGWSKVQVGSIVGFIRSDFLKYHVGDTPATFRATDGVHVRASASTSANSLTVVFGGDSISVLEHDPAGWSKVQVGSHTGYIRSDFLKHAGTATAPPDSSGSASQSGNSGASNAIEGVLDILYTFSNKTNMRAEPSTSARVLKELPINTSVGVLENESDGWTKVTHNGDIGYISSDLIAPEDVVMAQQVIEVLFTDGNVNMRTGAAGSASLIRTVPSGSAVEILAHESNGWSKVIDKGTVGYMKKEFLTADAPPLTVPQGGNPQVMYTKGDVRMRAGGSESSSILKVLANATTVDVLAYDPNGWSKVSHANTTGYIRSDLLSSEPVAAQNTIVGILKTITDVNVRKGPSQSHDIIVAIMPGTSVEVLAHESNGWSKVRVNGEVGYIRSDLLHAGASVEYVTMAEISHLLPTRQNIRVVDVRTGISFNIRIFSKGKHADYETATREDTDAMLRTRGGVRSWSARPLWVYAGDRVFAAASHSMPHDADWISGNGIDGHLCLHFKDTVTNNKRYQADLRAAVLEAYDKRPR